LGQGDGAHQDPTNAPIEAAGLPKPPNCTPFEAAKTVQMHLPGEWRFTMRLETRTQSPNELCFEAHQNPSTMPVLRHKNISLSLGSLPAFVEILMANTQHFSPHLNYWETYIIRI